MNRLITLLALMAVPFAAVGHHRGIEYGDTVIELEGRVEAALWRNPHVRLTLSVPSEDGSVQSWILEAEGVNTLGRSGINEDAIAEGSVIKVAGRSSTYRNRLYLSNVLLPSGVELRTRGNVEPRWSTEHIGFDEGGADGLPATASDAHGIFRVWRSRGVATLPLLGGARGFPADLPLTPVAAKAWEDWTPDDNLTLQCITGGMPAAMTRVSGPHPVDFIEQDGNIVMRVESFDVRRTFHMNTDADTTSQPFSRLGYSVGHWEDNTLVVHTSRVNWPYFTVSGSIPQSDAVGIIERFTLSDDGTELSYDMTVTDPTTFTEPVSAHWDFDWRPSVVVEPYGCTLGP